MISRFIEKQILSACKPGSVACLFGARRTGKTTLLHALKRSLSPKKVMSVHGQDLTTQEILSSQRTETLRRFVVDVQYLFVDEAQYIPNIGMNLKLLVDTVPNVAILVTGSSSFDLKNKVGEPLVGRSVSFHLYPLAQLELEKSESLIETQNNLPERLIYGSYPQVVTASNTMAKKKQLENLRDGYLLKDILEQDNLKDSLFVFNLLRLIAFQIGHDVSYAELASALNSHPKTVRRYLELLEKTFVIFSVMGFSRNLRKEYTKTPRYYFWDNGVRNVIISNFNAPNIRDDVGQLWENYCVSERRKRNAYQNLSANYYYWRTYDQKEIDAVEEREGKLYGYEMKWGKARLKTPKEFLSVYKNSTYQRVDQHNYLDFIT
ncbi:ATP-binding protein [bacterium]|uniref:AAA+ ATPase domain-containing protein n=2 Tax=Candidatus Roizmaniibacteriota TaxID=1752723 RepID=A0A2M7BTR0_9BACT|nr:ATP-binding protein [bacterium]PIU36742.1 MAG: hypothetical protein COT02_04475 [Candidatus Roizmanbacteria bacterium CG07_land_8_20_14_0_80_34_15]PIV08879.1 MAG: hypothetical protein COS52_00420 [Candidatus Roizmanbacteria bacterium CG03_land_8_20_14_0_80_39_12]